MKRTRLRLPDRRENQLGMRGRSSVFVRVCGLAVGLPVALLLGSCERGAKPASEAAPWAGISPTGQDSLPPPTEVLLPSAYVSKVKNLLTGLPPTEDEVQAVSKDPAALRALIDKWSTAPEHREKMLDFFRNAFQQNQVTLAGLQASVGLPQGFYANDTAPYNVTALLERSMMDSFALTVWRLLAAERPLNEALTTQKYMLNPPLMSLMSYIDELQVSDAGLMSNRFLQRTPNFSFTLDASVASIPIDQTLNPNSYYYMRFAHPTGSGCRQPVLTYNATQFNFGSNDNSLNLWNFLFGKMTGGCTTGTVNRFRSQWSDADWNDWRLVTIEKADPSEPTSPLFYDLVALRSTFEMRLKTPRVGFFGTLAFHANWATNASNVNRVTANQTLIVALGKSFDGSGSTTPIFDGTLDKDHATPGSSCYTCHQTLDPFRQFFRQSYSLFYHDQTDGAQRRLPASFAVDGVQAMGEGVGDLAKILAEHPRFAVAWTQKLCHWANSIPCMEDDPEFLRIAEVFRRSGYQWKTLVRELFSSPLVTMARNTRTKEIRGAALSVSRRDHFCVALSNRLGLTDVCGMATVDPSPLSLAIRRYAAFVPVDGYDRGLEIGSLSTDPNPFFRIATESMCMLLADRAVDSGPQPRYSSTAPDAAIADFVSTIMAVLPSDPRADEAQKILREHYTQAVGSGSSASEALKSTFTLACSSPASVIVGL